MKFAWWDLRFALALLVLAVTVMAGDLNLQLNLQKFIKRQSLGTGPSNPTTPTTDPTTTTGKATTTTNPQTTDTATTPKPLTSVSSTLTSTIASSLASGSSLTSSNPSVSDTSKTTFTSILMGSSTSHTTFVAITTSPDGQVVSTTVTSSSVVSSATGYATYTSTPGLAPGGGESGGFTGLTIDSKKIIGGVVGGIGGAILLGGIALVCWRIWGRKRTPGEDDGYGSAGSLNREKGLSGQLTADTEDPLQRYQTPGRPNAAANF